MNKSQYKQIKKSKLVSKPTHRNKYLIAKSSFLFPVAITLRS